MEKETEGEKKRVGEKQRERKRWRTEKKEYGSGRREVGRQAK